MPFDAYSFCPGGTGKKAKFCCPDLVKDLEKIDRMLDAEQYLACLQHVEQLQQKHPDRACLLATKALLLRLTGQADEARANAAAFLEKHPDNPTALAESAIITAAEQGGLAAVETMHRALAALRGGMQPAVYEAMELVAASLTAEGEWAAARALLHLQAVIARQDRRPFEMLLALNQSQGVPLLLKEEPSPTSCPHDAPWKDRFHEAVAPIRMGNWLAAADNMDALAREVGDSPDLWRSLATLRGWLCDKPASIEALRKFASLDVPLEEAVEAEARAMLSSEDPLGDRVEMLAATWTIKDADHLQAALTLDRRAVQIPFDLSSYGDEDSPPPKAAYFLYDHPIRERAEEVGLDDLSPFLGQAMLYGRQTDREARLKVIGVMSRDLEKINTVLAEIAGEALDGEVQQEVMAKVSASRELLYGKWRAPDDTTPEQLEMLADHYLRDALLKRWPQMEPGVFGGKSARQAAGDDGFRVRLLAAIMVLECWAERAPGTFDFNELRSDLGLPILEPIDPEQISLETLPLVRLSRVIVEKASDEAIVAGYRRAVMFAVRTAMGKFARAIIDRPSFAGREEQLQAYRMLARTERDPEAALQYVLQGREAAESAGQSGAAWDLLELSYRFTRGQGEEARRLVGHIRDHHFEEPGVADSLTELLVDVGILRPDGTPAPPPQPDTSVIVGADQPDPGPDKIWTPDSQQPGGGKKLWTPD